MSVTTATRKQVIENYRRHEGDSGSPEVQIALLTDRINNLTDHLRANRHDYNSRRGLIMLVGQRNRLLRYLQRSNRQGYLDVIGRLGLRK